MLNDIAMLALYLVETAAGSKIIYYHFDSEHKW